MIRRILLPLDGSALAEQVFHSALTVSAPFGAEIIVLRVVEPPHDAGCAEVVHWRFLRAEAEAYVQATVQKLAARGATVMGDVAEGDPAGEILRCAQQREVDLVVMGTHGGASRRLFPFGATIQQVANSLGLSLMIVPVSTEPGYDPAGFPLGNILVPLDGSQRAELALTLASPIANAADAVLHVAHVVPVPEMTRNFPCLPEDEEVRQQLVRRNQRTARAYLDNIERQHGDGVRLRCHLLTSPQIAHAIQRLARDEDIDLVVGCAHGHGGAADWLYGGVAGSLIAHCEVPLLVFQDLACEATIERGSGEWSAKGVRNHSR